MCDDRLMCAGWGARCGRGGPAVAAVAPLLALVLLAAAGCGTRTSAGAAGPAARPSIPNLGPERPPGITGVAPRYGATPTLAATPPGTPCPASGLRVAGSEPDAASGLRAMTLTVTACGADSLTVSGYPQVRVLDAHGRGLPVTVHRGASVTSAIDDPAPTTLALRPGRSALAVLAWRNTVTDSTVEAETGAALAVTVAGRPQIVPVTLDLGNTGTLDVTAWRQPPP